MDAYPLLQEPELAPWAVAPLASFCQSMTCLYTGKFLTCTAKKVDQYD